jgi:GNAT superfamily N-acetyltransferase
LVDFQKKMKFTIRPAHTEDSAAIAEILAELEYFSHYGEITPARVRRQFNRCLASDSHSPYVAETPAGEIVGYGAVHWLPTLFMPGPEGFVTELFVKSSARGHGVGAALLQAVIAEARQRGCTRLSLLNNRHRESYQRGFYRKQGWQEREALANFIYALDEEE